MRKIRFIALAAILTVAALLRLPFILQGFFAFTYDQGRDLLAVEQIIKGHLTLIGPTTGLPGIFYGPWWYFFLTPLFILSRGDPQLITLSFSFIGLLTVLLLYLLVKSLTKNTTVSLLAAFVAATSQVFLTASSQIWSPSLVLPLMIAFVYTLTQLLKTKNKSKIPWALVLGLITGLIQDTGAAFGIILSLSTLMLLLFLIKTFGLKKILLYILGIIIVLLPRIIFDLRHQLLITNSVMAWLKSPHVYQERLTIWERFINRGELLFASFAQTFTQSNKLFALIILLLLLIMVVLNFSALRKNKILKVLFLILISIYLVFSLFPDALWDYYLVGLPLIFIIIFAFVLKEQFLKNTVFASAVLILTIIFSFNTRIISPFSLNWIGDGAVYKNQVRVLNKIAPDLRGDYSIYIYTPAMFDYPFDYLISYYQRKKLIDAPKINQQTFYLIIRDDPSHLYMPVGWYGDKTHDKTIIIYKEDFPGDLKVEKHIKNE